MANALDRISHELKPSGYLVGESFSVAQMTKTWSNFSVVKPNFKRQFFTLTSLTRFGEKRGINVYPNFLVNGSKVSP